MKMIEAGMNVARLNFSHGDHEVHGRTVATIRAAVDEIPGAQVAIMLDTKGPEIRTGFLEEGKAISLTKGQRLEITTDYEFKGNPERIACSYKDMPHSVVPGNVILAADGSITMTVEECRPDEGLVVVTVNNDAVLGERKNMNLPGVKVNLPTVTEKDKHDIVQFAARMRLDMIAASFVQEGDDIDTIRGLLGPLGRMIKIIAKIENQEGLLNYDDILAKADGIMVARGDLGMEIPPEKVFMAQKMMIRKANLVGKPVITATQMLESMVKNPRPTRAECTDVANAVLDGTDCVMLSGETAGGQYPLEAVRMMSKVCMEAESIINYRQLYDAIRSSTLDELGEEMGTPEAIASAAVKTCIDMGAKALVVCSETGNSARHIAKYRPSVPILVLTATPEVARQVSGLSRGTVSMVMGSMIGTDSLLTHAAGVCKERGWAAQGDTIVAVHGMLEGKPGSTNLLKVLPVL
jgi:pyruvate kinase